MRYSVSNLVFFVATLAVIVLVTLLYTQQTQNNAFINATAEAVLQLRGSATNEYVSQPYMSQTSGYKHIGLLVPSDMADSASPLSLMARQIAGCDRWQYYTVMKNWIIPVTYKNKDCYTVGCNEITDGAIVTVPEYAGKTYIFRSMSF